MRILFGEHCSKLRIAVTKVPYTFGKAQKFGQTLGTNISEVYTLVRNMFPLLQFTSPARMPH